MKNTIIKTLYLFSVFTLFVSCNSSQSPKKGAIKDSKNTNLIEITKAQFQMGNMKLGTLTLHQFNETVQVSGMIDVPPSSRAQVSAIMGGYIKTAPFLVGNKVNKGQLLLTIENPDFIKIQQNFLEISETLKYLKSEYDRQKILFQENISSKKNYLKAESEYKSAVALYYGLEKKLQLMNINTKNVKAGKLTAIIPVYAPIAGSIVTVNTNVGKFMNTTDVLIEIVNDQHKHLELVVFAKDILKIKENQKIRFQIPEKSNKFYNASVHLIGTTIESVTRTVKVHGHLEDENELFLVGMFVEAKIIIGSKTKLALPVNAVFEENGNNYILVFKVKENNLFKFEKIAVEIGLKNENWVEIIDENSRLKNKKILTTGTFSY